MDDDDDDKFHNWNDKEIEGIGSAQFIVTEASHFIQEGDITVMKTDDDHPYYHLKLLANPYGTEEMVTDDYHHQFPLAHQIVVNSSDNKGDVHSVVPRHKCLYCLIGMVMSPIFLEQGL